LREAKAGLQFGKRCGLGVVPDHVASKWMEAEAHIRLIRLALLDGADRREGLQPVLLTPGMARRIQPVRRVVDDAIAGLDAAQRRGLAVGNLHETLAASNLDMFGGGDRQPIAGH
jgi:hypothetical protein